MRPWIYRPRRVDKGQATIIRALRLAGAYVVDLSAVGGGVPDLLVSFRGASMLLEVKSPAGPKGGVSKKGQHLRESQEEFRRDWCGWPTCPVYVVRSHEEAIRLAVDAAAAVKAWPRTLPDGSDRLPVQAHHKGPRKSVLVAKRRPPCRPGWAGDGPPVPPPAGPDPGPGEPEAEE